MVRHLDDADDTQPMPKATIMPRAKARSPLVAHSSGAVAGAPSVGRMVADAYHAVSSQLGQYRVHAQSGRIFSDKEAQTLKTLVQSLATLHELERKHSAGDLLGRLSDTQLAELARGALKPSDLDL